MKTFRSLIYCIAVSIAASGVAFAEPAPRAADQTLGMALMSVMVTRAGVLVCGEGVTAVERLNVGLYSVDFGRSVQNCFYTVSINNTESVLENANASTAQGASPNRLFVGTLCRRLDI